MLPALDKGRAAPISQGRGLPMAGHTAGSMQWVGQIQSANDT